MATDDRADLVVVAGGTTQLAATALEEVLDALRGTEPGVAVVHHDLRDVARGVVHRRVRLGGSDTTSVLDLAHGCASCTLREDVLPLLVHLAARPEVTRLLLHLDPVLAPEQACRALAHVVVDGPRGRGVVTDAATLRGVVTVVDGATWLADATSDADVADRGLARLPDDERTIAQLVVAQAEFADVLVVAGAPADRDLHTRTDAVLARLAPLARRLPLARVRPDLFARLPDGACRGRSDSPHAPLLRGQPPLHEEAGVRLHIFTARRPFHPDRLHRALDALLDGVVRTRGRIWLATRPESVLWLESAGGGLEIGHAGDWLAAGTDTDWDDAEPERRAAAALRWHPRWGDRAQELALLTAADGVAGRVDEALRGALLTDDETALGEACWREYPDPFGWWHTEPCDDLAPEPARGPHRRNERG